MPVIFNHSLHKSCILGIWEITEDLNTLFSKIRLNENEMKMYASFSNDTRRKQWLSYRCLISEILPSSINISINYNKFGQPFIENKQYFLSVSHSGVMSAAIISPFFNVGIDIETIRNRIDNITSKFLSSQEILTVGNENRLEQLIVYWSAKEALYKMYGKGNLIFAENLIIEPFVYHDEGGIIKGMISTIDFRHSYDIFYKKISNYISAYVIDKDKTINLQTTNRKL